jgi:large subunit ribosomal protein L10
MGLNRQDKAAVIEEMSEIVANSSVIVIAEYRGLTVEAITKLRADARQQGAQLRVVKNTLVRRAVAGTPFEGLADKFVGPLIYGFSADPVAAAKVLYNFSKTNKELVIKGGAMADNVMDVETVEKLAMTPSRDELLAKLTATLKEPIAKFVRTVAAYRDAQEEKAAE